MLKYREKSSFGKRKTPIFRREFLIFPMVPKGGLEPPHLSAYAPQAYMSTISSPGQIFSGAPSRVRTYNQRFRRPLLFQLSYGCLFSTYPESNSADYRKNFLKGKFFLRIWKYADNSFIKSPFLLTLLFFNCIYFSLNFLIIIWHCFRNKLLFFKDHFSRKYYYSLPRE